MAIGRSRNYNRRMDKISTRRPRASWVDRIIKLGEMDKSSAKQRNRIGGRSLAVNEDDDCVYLFPNLLNNN